MQGKYTTKDMKKATTKAADGSIYKKDGMWFFNWKGSQCGYASESDAKKGLVKLSGTAKKKA